MENKTKPGEKGFAFVLLGFGIFVLVSAVDMYHQSPSVSSYGAMPLFLGILLTVFSLIIIVQNFRKESAISGKRISEQASIALLHLFSKDVTVMILLLLLYSIALFLGAGFTVATSIYLWLAMSYLTKKNYLRNVLYTALLMAFVLLVFKVLFHIILP